MALMCGMTPTQFWYEEPRLIHSYLCKHKMVLDKDNDRAWLFGLYVYKAVGVAISNNFNEKSKETYFEKPIEELYKSYKPKKEYTHQDKVNYWAKFKNKKKGGK